MPLPDVADAAMDTVAEAHKKAGIELQRRLIQALFIFHQDSELASRRLLLATLVIVGLTVGLIVLTVVLIVVA
jgi:hypothetical protein